MKILKSMVDGIGTAAGVAWPSFGVFFGILGLTIGGTAAVILASISSGLFLVVALPIAYWSYRNNLKDKKKQYLIFNKAKNQTYQLAVKYLWGLFLGILTENITLDMKSLNYSHIKALLIKKITNDAMALEKTQRNYRHCVIFLMTAVITQY